MSNLSSLVLGTVLALAALTACKKDNPNFCEGTPEECMGVDGPIDSPPESCDQNGPDPECPAANPVCTGGECVGDCTSDTDCAGRPPNESVCHTGSGACVQCDEDDRQAAPGAEDECTAPQLAVCDAQTHTCRACEAHLECVSGICDDGRCVPEGEIVFIATNGADNAACTRAAPCLTLNKAIDEVQAMPATFKYILMAPSATAYDARNNTDRADFDQVEVYVVGTNASVQRNGDGVVLEVRGNSNVTIDGLTIKNGRTSSGSGITCASSTLTLRGATVTANQGFGVGASTCTLSVTGSTFSLNTLAGIDASNVILDVSRSSFVSNSGGGINLSSGSFQVVNNFILGNGNLLTSTFGGLNLSSGTPTNKLEFNTVARNTAQVGVTDGIICTNATLVARNNIVIGAVDRTHVSGNCAHIYTLFTPNNMVNGEMNAVIATEAEYNFVGGNDFHITAGSAAAGRAQNTNLIDESAFDVDGDIRSGGAVDVGADEIP